MTVRHLAIRATPWCGSFADDNTVSGGENILYPDTWCPDCRQLLLDLHGLDLPEPLHRISFGGSTCIPGDRPSSVTQPKEPLWSDLAPPCDARNDPHKSIICTLPRGHKGPHRFLRAPYWESPARSGMCRYTNQRGEVCVMIIDHWQAHVTKDGHQFSAEEAVLVK